MVRAATLRRTPLPPVKRKLEKQRMIRTTMRMREMLPPRVLPAEVRDHHPRLYYSKLHRSSTPSPLVSLSCDLTVPAAKKKKKRKPKKKKKGGAKVQSSPPRVPVSNLFPNNQYPEGEIVEYKNENSYRTTNEEKRYLDRMNNDFLQEYRQGAEVHRQVRQYAQKNIKPGQTLTEIAEGIEDSVRALTGHQGLEEGDNIKGGMGFPCGLSINHCAAHYTPNAGNKMVLNHGDVMKVDFGAHLNGRIVDSAFTVAFDPVYDPLLEAVKDATNTGIREAGIDVRMSDIGAAIQEAMESYEVELNGTMHPVKCIRNLNGHNIDQHIIHGGKSVPIVKGTDQTKMEEGEVFAIETFGSTGKGYVRDDVSDLEQCDPFHKSVAG